ncbi:MAG: spondin domain-containing protein [Gammaproteobacteria bacterium]|nr:spondin domain-containing protein [Gammaproteobacteria bacterium]
MKSKYIYSALVTLAATVGLHAGALATQVQVTVENLTGEGGLYFTPLWVGFHDGGFDSFDVGGNASASIEAIAEGGDASGLRADFSASGGVDGVIVAPEGFGGAPVFDPGDLVSASFDVDPLSQAYFSFASMVIPSNDAFIGNDDPMAYRIFDATGVFVGPVDILVTGAEVWDAGTELNDGLGAAFSTLGGTSTDEMMAIGVHGGLGALLGSTTAAGTVIDPVAGDFTQPGYALARITINAVPAPPTLAMLALGAVLVSSARRRYRRAAADLLAA